MDNVQPETSQPEAVVFRSGDIRSTQSKNSPKYFVNIKTPRQKLTKKQKTFIGISIGAIILVIIILILAFIPRDTHDDQQVPTIIENAEASSKKELEKLKEYNSQKTAEIFAYHERNTDEDTIYYINDLIESVERPEEKGEIEIIKFDFYKVNGQYDRAISELATVDTEGMLNEQKYRFYRLISGLYADSGDQEKSSEYYLKAMEYITGSVEQFGGEDE